MAIRKLANRKKPFQVYWNNPFTGGRESESFETELEAKKHDALIKYRLKFEREMFRPERKEEKAAAKTVESVYYLYLKDKRLSMESLKRSIESMRQILDRIGTLEIEKVTPDTLSTMKSSMLETGVKGTTYRRRVATLKAAFNWAKKARIISAVPEFPPMPTADYERHVPPTREELDRMLAVAPEHIRRMVTIGTQMGVRVGPSELFKITWADVDLNNARIRVHSAKRKTQDAWRYVPIRESLLAVFREWMEQDAHVGALTVIHYRGKPVKNIKTAWNATLRRAGIERKVWPYDLRHAFATNMLSADVDPGTVAQIMGTSTAMIFEHYQHVDNAQKRMAVERLPEIGNVHRFMCTKENGSLLEQ